MLDIIDKPEQPEESPKLKRAVFVTASLLSVWLILMLLFYHRIWHGKPDELNPNFEIPYRVLLGFRIVWSYYLVCTLAAWHTYFSKLPHAAFRSRLRGVIAFSIVPLLFLLAVIFIMILKDVNAFFTNL